MAGKIIELNDISETVLRLKEENKKIVLVGGCFDIIHPGHILFLEAAKREGDALILLLESDESIKKRKGNGRPINSQKNRQIVVSAISDVDYIIPLVGVTTDEEYDRIMIQIRPEVIAITEGDSQTDKRKKQCESIGSELKVVIKKIDNRSTTALINEIRG
ncbi:MAG: adenylyltransferase/cytidyltransferase family protein [Candidatus Levybacteria bacterium]|nr:adenylyltransferase/cytidyltransferase family protein [Candidatus Levybacteria bacterium]